LESSSPGVPQSRLDLTTIAVCVVVPTVLAIVVYRSIVGLWFWTDDFLWLNAATNPSVIDSAKEALEFPRGATPYWRPLVDFYFFAMYRTAGENATAYHVATLVLHTASAALLGLLAFRITSSRITAALAAALFVISPTYSTMVPWASGVTATLSGFFAIATVYLYVQWLLGGRSYRWLVWSAATLAAALLSKEDAIAVVGVLAVAALVLRPPERLRDLRVLGLTLAPFAAIGIAYALLQLLTVVGTAETPRLSIGLHAVPNLVDMMNWISLPWSLHHADWVSPVRWAALATFTAVAALAAVRRQWLLPALYAATVLMLVPSSFFTGQFAPRWTYQASLPWAFFIAVLITHGYEWLSARNRIVGVTAFGAVSFVLLAALAGRSIDSQNWVPGVANQYRSIERGLAANCTGLTEDSSVYLFPLPVVNSIEVVPQLVRVFNSNAAVNQVSRSSVLQVPLPRPNDCALSWNPVTGYTAQAVSQDRSGFAFWQAESSPNLLGETPDAVPWQGELEASTDGLVVSSDMANFGVRVGDTPAVGALTYIASAWVRAADAHGAGIRIFLGQETRRGAESSAADFTLTNVWQQIAVTHRARAAEPGTLSISVVSILSEPLERSFQIRDPEIKLFSVQSPLQ